jgi:hypothetical protein
MHAMSDVQWVDLHNRYMTDWPAVAILGAHAWRQAAEVAQRDSALASNLQCNSWSINGICWHLDAVGVRPDLMTMEWAMAQEGTAPPVPYFVARS